MAEQEEQKSVIVIGHKNPDTDSICSAIAYAYLKNTTDEAQTYQARRAGELSEETKFVLNYFKQPVPQICLDVSPQVEDLHISRAPGADPGITLRRAWEIMNENGTSTLSILDGDRRIQGVITLTDIAKANMNNSDSSVLSNAKTPFANIVETLKAKLVVGDIADKVETGKICVAAGTAEAMSTYLEKGDTVILCNRSDSQIYAIEMNAGCVIVTLNTEVPEHIRKLAANHNTIVISTPYDTYTAARVITQSTPVSYYMKTDELLSFSLQARIEDVQKVVAKVRHRYFPVVDADGRYCGMMSRRNMMDLRRKKIIMVDHNEIGQAVDGLMDAEILEIIDHHRLGSGIQTAAPVYFRGQPVGCTSTIVYQMYQEKGAKIPPEIAGLMCSAILSDTLAFRSPTCTIDDRNAAEKLAAIAGIDIAKYSEEMFEAGSSLEGKSAQDIFYTDFKPFAIGDFRFGIGQSNFMSSRSSDKAKALLLPYLNEAMDKKGLDFVCYMLTNILTESTDLIFAGKNDADAREIIRLSFGAEGTSSVMLPGVVSRKKQMVPDLTRGIEQWQQNK
jgi:manganese-dependent inorganic pyrophosphatase